MVTAEMSVLVAVAMVFVKSEAFAVIIVTVGKSAAVRVAEVRVFVVAAALLWGEVAVVAPEAFALVVAVEAVVSGIRANGDRGDGQGHNPPRRWRPEAAGTQLV